MTEKKHSLIGETIPLDDASLEELKHILEAQKTAAQIYRLKIKFESLEFEGAVKNFKYFTTGSKHKEDSDPVKYVARVTELRDTLAKCELSIQNLRQDIASFKANPNTGQENPETQDIPEPQENPKPRIIKKRKKPKKNRGEKKA